MKFVGFEDIYENSNAGTDYWVICSDLPQKYIDEAKEIDGDSYLESCFGLIATYGYIGAPTEEAEKEWFVDFDAPFYVDNDGKVQYGLEELNWDPDNYKALVNVIKEYGKDSKNYDEKKMAKNCRNCRRYGKN